MLQGLPGVQGIFEPLIPLWNARVRELTGWDREDPYFRAVYLRPDRTYPGWDGLISETFAGRVRNYWTDYQRHAMFPNRFLIKEIRANLMLGHIYTLVEPTIVYVVRHPCAVVHSRTHIPTPWHADVGDILVQEELVSDYLQPLVHEIEREKDAVGAHAVWWMVENHIALDQLSRTPHYLVYYEELVLRPEAVLQDLIAWLGYSGLPRRVRSKIGQPSRMSDHTLGDQGSGNRLSRWRSGLSVDEQERVLVWARRLNPTLYGNAVLPLALEGLQEELETRD
jgi:hypothetical protein